MLPGVLQEVQVPILSLQQCRTMKYKASRITTNMLCAGKGHEDSCQVSLSKLGLEEDVKGCLKRWQFIVGSRMSVRVCFRTQMMNDGVRAHSRHIIQVFLQKYKTFFHSCWPRRFGQNRPSFRNNHVFMFQGDSGGPLLLNGNADKHTIVGKKHHAKCEVFLIASSVKFMKVLVLSL